MSKHKKNNYINKEINNTKNENNNTFSWLVEFSKKVVFGAYIVFLLSITAIIILLFLNNINGDSSGFDIFITETNDTFKVVVAGYCLKATFENIFKINNVNNMDLIKIKNKIIKHNLSKNQNIKFDDENNDNNEEIDDCTQED